MSSSIGTRLRRGVGAAFVLAGLAPAAAHAQSLPARMVMDIDGPGSSSNPRLLTPLGNQVIFVIDRFGGSELWKSDGSAFPGTAQFWSFPPGFTPVEVVAWNGAVYFTLDRGPAGFQLWRTDGTPQGTTSLTDPSSGFPNLRKLTPIGSRLVFLARDGAGRHRLWETDGTAPGTRAMDVPDLDVEPRALVDLGGALLFVAADPSGGASLWRSDGTFLGTQGLVFINNAGLAAADVDGLIVAGGTAFFLANPFSGPRQLFLSDGTSAGSRQVFEMQGLTTVGNLVGFRGQLYFTADAGFATQGLWTLEPFGPNFFPRGVFTLQRFPDGPHMANFRAAETQLFFTADNDTGTGTELWSSDGLLPGFFLARHHLVKDLLPGPESSSPQFLTDVNGTLFFQARGPFSSGVELWTSFADEQSTFMQDLTFNSGSSGPADFTVAGGRVFFTADNGFSGRELWTIDNQAPVADAGPDQTVDPGTLVNLSGSGSHDPDSPPFAPLAGEWRDVFNTPISHFPFASYPIDAPGSFQFEFIAHDWMGGRSEDTVIVSTPGRMVPAVTVTSPSSGEEVHTGLAADIQWTATDADGVAGVRVLFSTDRGASYVVLPGCDVPGTATSCPWTPKSPAEEARIRVEVTDAVGDRGFTDVDFRIAGPLSGPQRLEITTIGVDGAGGGLRVGDFDFCPVFANTTHTCTFFYPPGTELAIEPQPFPGSTLTGWSGACTGTGPCTITMNGSRQLTATFGLQQVVLTVIVESANGGEGAIGVIGPPGTPPGVCEGVAGGTRTCTFSYPVGAPVELRSAPGPGSALESWTAPCPPSPSCVLFMDGDHEVTAVFAGRLQLAITVAGVDGGVGVIRGTTSDGQFLICPPGPGDPPQTCTFDVNGGVSVQLEALSEGETGFTGWSGGPCSGTDPFCSFTVEGNTAVTGTFQAGVRKRLDVITASSDNARGNVVLSGGNFCAVIPSNEPNTSGCTLFYNAGTVVTMAAEPEPGTVFLGWSGACAGTGACTVTMDQAREVTGTFRGPSRRLTLQVNSVGGGRGSVRNSVNNGLCTTTGNPATCVVTVPLVGTVVTLTALPQTGWRLLAWSGACSGNGACQVTMSDAVTVGATFGPLNRPPVANAGGPYAGVRNVPVTFDGSGSSDPDGDALSYAWDFGDGTQGTGVSPTHTYATLGTFTVTLVVSDGQASSAPATTTATIANRPPVANAGGPYAGVRNAPVTFDGSGSSDPDGDALTYAWDFGDGTQGAGVAPSHAYATLGTFTVTLVVSDGQASSAPATATVAIMNALPQANAGPDQTVRRLTVVVLDGRTSTDGDGTLTAFAWRQVSGPSVSLISPNTPRTAFIAPLVLFNPVVLEFELKVTDNDGATATDRVRVTVTR